MSSNYPELVFNEEDPFTADRLNKAMQVIDQRLRSLEPFTPSWQAAVDELRAVGLSRLNDAILPAYNRVQLLSAMGFLFAGSETPITLAVGAATFNIGNLDERDLFVPTPFVAITRASTTEDYAIAQLVSYDKTTGDLMVQIKSVTGNPGPFSDWQIGALAANTIAAMRYFAEIDAARTEALNAKTSAITSAAQTSADRIQTGADRAAAAQSAASAAQSAANAQVWNPANYPTKTEVATEDAKRVLIAGNQNLTGGFTANDHSIGSVSSGSITIDPLPGNIKSIDNAGPHTLVAPSGLGTCLIEYTNVTGAGTVTLSGFTKVTGAALTTTVGHEFLLYIARTKKRCHLHIVAMQ